MFDNPFDSFHNAVAEAKEEREQLDRLLTISTPRERLLVIVICVSVVAFAAWLFLGQVSQSISINGTLTFSDEFTQTSDTSTDAKVAAESFWLTHKEVQHISVGLGATIEVTMSDGETMTINGKVAEIDAARAAGEIQPSQTQAATGLYRVYLTLNEEFDVTAISNRNCRIAIELGRRSPISLFGINRA